MPGKSPRLCNASKSWGRHRLPHWKPVTWLDNADGIALKLPDSENEKKQLVTSDIRINCKMPPSTLYEYVIKGQSVSRLTGESKTSRSVPARYFVE